MGFGDFFIDTTLPSKEAVRCNLCVSSLPNTSDVLSEMLLLNSDRRQMP